MKPYSDIEIKIYGSSCFSSLFLQYIALKRAILLFKEQSSKFSLILKEQYCSFVSNIALLRAILKDREI